MSQFRQAFEPWGVAYERRLVERRRVDRAEQAQGWIALLTGAWLLSQATGVGVLCVAIDIPDTGFLVAEVALIVRLAAAGLGFVTLGIAATLVAVTLWNRSALSAGWVVAGLTPWLLLVVETAGLLLLLAAL